MNINHEELEEFINSDITPTAAFNIILSAVNAGLEAGVYDTVDQSVIKKAIATIKDKTDEGKNFMIKVK